MFNKTTKFILMAALMMTSGLSFADGAVQDDEIVSLSSGKIFSLPLMNYTREKVLKAADTKLVVQDDKKKNDMSESRWFQGVKWTSGFASLAYLTDPLTNAALNGVETTVYSLTGSRWLAKTARVGSFKPAYEFSKNSAFILGHDAPSILMKAYQNPTDFITNTGEIVKVGLKIAAVHTSSYLLTQPINEILSSSAYYGIWCVTGNAMLSQAAYVSTKGAMHYSGLSHTTAKIIGYKVVDTLGYPTETIGRKVIDFGNYSAKTIANYASNWWYGSKS